MFQAGRKWRLIYNSSRDEGLSIRYAGGIALNSLSFSSSLWGVEFSIHEIGTQPKNSQQSHALTFSVVHNHWYQAKYFALI